MNNPFSITIKASEIEITGTNEQIIESIKEVLTQLRETAPNSSVFNVSFSASIDIRTITAHRQILLFERLLQLAKQRDYNLPSVCGQYISVEQWVAIGLTLPDSDEAKSYHKLLKSHVMKPAHLSNISLDILRNYPDVQDKARYLLLKYCA